MSAFIYMQELDYTLVITRMAYVPPHKRVPAGDAAAAISSSSTAARRRVEGDASIPFYTSHELEDCLGVNHLHTLSNSLASPDSLTAIIIHDGQHPEWPPTIMCKTNVEILPSDATDETHEYPLFKEAPFRRTGREKAFEFDGWWRIVVINFLEPRSEELVAMLDKKFSRPQRRGGFGSGRRDQGQARTVEAWTSSLNRRWAVVSLEKNTARKDNPVNEFAVTTQRLRRLRDEQMSLQISSESVNLQSSPNVALLSKEDLDRSVSPFDSGELSF